MKELSKAKKELADGERELEEELEKAEWKRLGKKLKKVKRS